MNDPHVGKRLPGSINVVLVEPEIPPNTGNVARLCGATCSTLHLVHPLGFRTDDKSLKRAGLDYWEQVRIVHHRNLESFLNSTMGENLLFFSTTGTAPYSSAPFSSGCYLVFGCETRGLPRELLRSNPDKTFKIPIWGKVRSLNLSTSAGVVVYEAYRQLAAF